ncbi:MAG: 4Fe-4S binding protein [Chloroflexi bacterium]|jgi:Pyruvate/2-oxoacid:ferredoxin oxidoreductase delta subunit|nr:4Fe-4S binding protein [Chloroflexota bacterium]
MRKWAAIVIGGLAGALAGLWLLGERGHLLLPSTRAWLRALGWRSVLTPRFWHGYLYARWSSQYVGGAVRYVFPRLRPVPGETRWADVYHGKILPTPLAQKLISVNEDIPLQDLEQIIPYPTARQIVLHGPPDVVVYECPCRAGRENPCQPTQVCMIVGKPFTDFVLEHNPHSSRRLTQQEALDLLQAEHERGHLHAAYFKDVMLDRFYAICNCCACCCGGIEAMRQRGAPMITSSGYVAQVDEGLCTACGTCAESCPFEAITVNGAAAITWEACMGCGVCIDQCPDDALALVLDARKGPPLDADHLRRVS